MDNILIIILSGLSVLTLILVLLIWNYERAASVAAQERACFREAVRRIEAGGKLNKKSHGDGFEYRD